MEAAIQTPPRNSKAFDFMHLFYLFVMSDLEQAFAVDLKIWLFYQHSPTLLFKGHKYLIVLQSVHTSLPDKGNRIICILLLLISAVSPFF